MTSPYSQLDSKESVLSTILPTRSYSGPMGGQAVTEPEVIFAMQYRKFATTTTITLCSISAFERSPKEIWAVSAPDEDSR
jgi:hypothetical protein